MKFVWRNVCKFFSPLKIFSLYCSIATHKIHKIFHNFLLHEKSLYITALIISCLPQQFRKRVFSSFFFFLRFHVRCCRLFFFLSTFDCCRIASFASTFWSILHHFLWDFTAKASRIIESVRFLSDPAVFSLRCKCLLIGKVPIYAVKVDFSFWLKNCRVAHSEHLNYFSFFSHGSFYLLTLMRGLFA